MRYSNIWRSISRTPQGQTPSDYADAVSASEANPRVDQPRFLKSRVISWSADRRLFFLDLAYLAVLPPLLLLVKVPMLLFLLAVALLLLARKRGTAPTQLFVAMAGLAAIFFSLYGAFNFAGLSRLKLFVELMVYLLLLAVSLQRLTRRINIYLLLSPALLLALSLFFFDSIVMLAYVVVEIFLLLWIMLAFRMRSDAIDSLRMTGMLFALALPWVVLLFIFFPRISFEHASYGFRGDSIHRTGHDGTMRLDSAALLVPSERIVMEVGFTGGVPGDAKLYFRGSVLYLDRKDHWEPLPPFIRRDYVPRKTIQKGMVETADELTVYKVSLYPTHKRWLYLLDLPYEAPEGAVINADFETKLEKPIDEPQYYDAGSALAYRYGKNTDPAILEAALDVNTSANPQTLEAAQRIAQANPSPRKRLQAIMRFFADSNLTYSLHPDPLDLNRSTDSFLFDKRKGYCVHFAGSFVTMARISGLPARVVTGYKADRKNSVNTYLAVKERDAHAWAEVYLGDHWERVETTATAARIDDESVALLQQGKTADKAGGQMAQVNLYLMYLKYQVETWILQYSHFRQMQLIDKLKKRPEFAAGFFASLLLLALLSAALFFYLRRPRCRDRALCALRPVIKRLRKLGYGRREGETLHRLFERYCRDHPDADDLARIDRLYHQMRYADTPVEPGDLKRLVSAFLRR